MAFVSEILGGVGCWLAVEWWSDGGCYIGRRLESRWETSLVLGDATVQGIGIPRA